jgi:hypothetical protein
VRPLSPEALWADDESDQRLSEVVPEDAPLRSVAAPREADALAKTAMSAAARRTAQVNGAKASPAGEESLLAPQPLLSSMEDAVPPRVPPLPPPAVTSGAKGPRGTAGEEAPSSSRRLWLPLMIVCVTFGLCVVLWSFLGSSAASSEPGRDTPALARAQVELELAAEAIQAGLPDVALRHAERAAALDRGNTAAMALQASLRAQLASRVPVVPPSPVDPEPEVRETPPSPGGAAVTPDEPPAPETEPAATEPPSELAAIVPQEAPQPEGLAPPSAAPAAVEPAGAKAETRKAPPRKRRSSSKKRKRQRRAMSESEAGDMYRKAVRLVRDDDEKQGCALMSRVAKEAPEGSNWRVKAAAGVDRYGCR